MNEKKNYRYSGDRFIPLRETSDKFFESVRSIGPADPLPSSSSSTQIDRNAVIQSEFDAMLRRVLFDDAPSYGSSILRYREEIKVGNLVDNEVNLKRSMLNSIPIDHHVHTRQHESYRKLDAPGLLEDFYINILDWSSKDIIFVGLGAEVHTYNHQTKTADEIPQAIIENGTSEDTHIGAIKCDQIGLQLAIGDSDGRLYLQDIEKKKTIRAEKVSSDRINVIEWKDDLLATGGRNGQVCVFDRRVRRENNSRVFEQKYSDGEVCGLKWSSDGKELASGANDNMVCIWDTRMAKIKHKLEHEAAVKAISWCPWQPDLLITGAGTDDRCIRIWNTVNGNCVDKLNTNDQIVSIICNPDSKSKELLTTHGYPNHYVNTWSYPRLKRLTTSEFHTGRVLHSVLSPDGTSVATLGADEALVLCKPWQSSIHEKKKKSIDDNNSYKKSLIRVYGVNNATFDVNDIVIR